MWQYPAPTYLFWMKNFSHFMSFKCFILRISCNPSVAGANDRLIHQVHVIWFFSTQISWSAPSACDCPSLVFIMFDWNVYFFNQFFYSMEKLWNTWSGTNVKSLSGLCLWTPQGLFLIFVLQLQHCISFQQCCLRLCWVFFPCSHWFINVVWEK